MPQALAKFNTVLLRMPFRYAYARLPLAFLVLCSMWSVAESEVIAKRSFSYFDIKGNTADELDAALNARGPETMGASSRHPGATRIRFGGEATYLERDGRCYIGGVRVTVDIEIILPRWRQRAHAEKRLSEVWDRLASDIKRHEEHHAEIATQHAHMMEEAILALPSAQTCDLLQAKVTAESERNIVLHDKDQAHFDLVEAANFQNRIQGLTNGLKGTQGSKK